MFLSILVYNASLNNCLIKIPLFRRLLCWPWSDGTHLLPLRRRSSWPCVAGAGSTWKGPTRRKWWQQCDCPSWPWQRCWTWCDRPACWAQTTCWTPSRPAPRAATWTSTTVACSVSALSPPSAYCYYNSNQSHQTSTQKCDIFWFLCFSYIVCVLHVLFLLLWFQSQRRTSPPWSTELR